MIVLGVLMVSGLCGTQTAYGEPVRMGGTGASLGTIRILADAYRKVDPQFSLEIVPNLGSGGGLKALERDLIHFAAIGRPLKPDEAAKGYVATEYGRTPFVLATTRKDIKGLTLREIADIYAGKVAKWPDGTPIRLVLRPQNDFDTPLLASLSPAIKAALEQAMAREGMTVAVTDQDSASRIEQLKGALGTSSLALIVSENRPLSTIPIEGVKPTVKALSEGTYPYHKSLYVVTRANPSEAVIRFIAFIRSPQGRQLLNDMGHWVAEAPKSATASAK